MDLQSSFPFQGPAAGGGGRLGPAGPGVLFPRPFCPTGHLLRPGEGRQGTKSQFILKPGRARGKEQQGHDMPLKHTQAQNQKVHTLY